MLGAGVVQAQDSGSQTTPPAPDLTVPDFILPGQDSGVTAPPSNGTAPAAGQDGIVQDTSPRPPPYEDGAADAPGGVVRVLDKITGDTTDLTLDDGQTGTVGLLSVTLNTCRYMVANPSGNAWGEMTITVKDMTGPVFEGWMIASAPAIHALDHPRYDVWMLRCTTP
ncbi:MAG: DUF2155 domain-containing protein [Limimaricola sp.]|nr:DUF2155 domain-containing protein [Limimaricola sp.]